MPLTPKGERIKKQMQSFYGKDKGEQVFYASANAGNITGVHENHRRLSPQECAMKRFHESMKKRAGRCQT